jgi:hypothetical protein
MRNRRALFLAGLLGSASTALAQAPGRYANEEPAWLLWAVLAGTLVVICASAFINPKRSHLS